MAEELPSLRWGIIATGLISSWFVADLTLDRPDKKANHIIQAIGASSLDKGQLFVKNHLSGKSPAIYGTYEGVYQDLNVDIVYIGTPNAFHKQNCLDAIRAGKHVLCEKTFTLNESEANEVFQEADKHGVFVMEAMWTRFFPLVQKFHRLIHSDKIIGNVSRVFCDFAMNMNIASLPSTSRLRNPSLGAGSLLDVGIYSLTWAILALQPGNQQNEPKVVATQSLFEGIDIATTVVLSYPNGEQAIATSSTMAKTPPSFCRVEGSKGTIVVDGFTASVPATFTVHLNGQDPVKYEFERPGKGFYWEADAVAIDIAAGRVQNEIMPWSETLRMMRLLDEIRRQGGARFPQDAN